MLDNKFTAISATTSQTDKTTEMHIFSTDVTMSETHNPSTSTSVGSTVQTKQGTLMATVTNALTLPDNYPSIDTSTIDTASVTEETSNTDSTTYAKLMTGTTLLISTSSLGNSVTMETNTQMSTGTLLCGKSLKVPHRTWNWQ